MDWLTNRRTEVLVRSYFQPDDHNNPTFLVLPDERIMIFYTRHTDEPKIWYRISQKPGDITLLGEEKYIAVANNTTYPSPFILSDDPEHIYLCWRGINWHPTMARLTMPDENDNVKVDFGPKQIVQSTGARPYAKYYSNGNAAKVNGWLRHDNFHRPVFDFNITHARNFLCYDVTPALSPDWYGTVYGNGSAYVKGGPGICTIGVNMETRRNSKFTFVLSDEVAASEYTFITFRDRNAGNKVEETDSIPQIVKELTAKNSNDSQSKPSVFKIDIQADINNDAQLTVVMDPVGGDKIRGYGKGNLRQIVKQCQTVNNGVQREESVTYRYDYDGMSNDTGLMLSVYSKWLQFSPLAMVGLMGKSPAQLPVRLTCTGYSSFEPGNTPSFQYAYHISYEKDGAGNISVVNYADGLGFTSTMEYLYE